MAFQPTTIDLPPMFTLLTTANVTEDDTKQAFESWQNKPPDDTYANILNAEVINDE